MQWSSFDDSFEQLMNWVHDMESQVIAEPDAKSTLQEKKAVLQNLKVYCLLLNFRWLWHVITVFFFCCFVLFAIFGEGLQDLCVFLVSFCKIF